MKDDLEEVLDALCMYGKPHMWLRDNGTWYCKVDMHTNIKGVVLELKAAAEHKELRAALYDVLQQAAKTVSTFEFKIGGNPK